MDYSEKLTQIIALNDIKSVTVVRMEVPCCGGIEFAVKRAAEASGKDMPLKVVTISTDGRISFRIEYHRLYECCKFSKIMGVYSIFLLLREVSVEFVDAVMSLKVNNHLNSATYP